jgi:hypothetical protein
MDEQKIGEWKQHGRKQGSGNVGGRVRFHFSVSALLRTVLTQTDDIVSHI